MFAPMCKGWFTPDGPRSLAFWDQLARLVEGDAGLIAEPFSPLGTDPSLAIHTLTGESKELSILWLVV